MYSERDIDLIRNAVVYDATGTKVGNVSDVYLDDRTGDPTWVTVNTGFFGTKTSFVPLTGSRLDDERLNVTVDKDVVKNAPQMDEDGHLDRAQEDDLYRYYQVDSAVEGDRMRTRRWDRDAAPAPVPGDRRDDRDYDRRDDRRDDDVYADELRRERAERRDDRYDDHRDDRDYDRRDDRRDDGPLLDRDRDGRGPVGEVLDGPDGSPSDRRGDRGYDDRRDDRDYDRRDDRRDDGPLLDRDRDGRGPVGEVLDGPDDERGRPRR